MILALLNNQWQIGLGLAGPAVSGESRKDLVISACLVTFTFERPLNQGCSELFAADSTTNVLCLDLRNGRVLYGYQGK